ncbi:MAG: HlyD family efflux transporter periplasmic adaptor subunit [Deltaproteobacteria bacterium]|nr:HlyD family efflux transporter periplasmic adaptor subunit [Deltaproteobacteria bacterium]
MSIAFQHTLRSLRAGGRHTATVAFLVAALVAWCAWLFLARITVYAVSVSARIEVDQESHPIEPSVSGRVVASRLTLDRFVEEGEVLVELDSEPQRLELEQERARLAAIGPQLKGLRTEIGLLDRAQRDASRADIARVEEERARGEESQSAVRLAEDELERKRRLFEAGALQEAERRRAEADAEQRRAAASALRLGLERASWEQRTGESSRRATLERLQREAAALEGEQHIVQSRIASLENEIVRRRIVSPVSGRLGEARPVKLGEYLQEGDRLGAVVPPGTLRAVAEYEPASALGRIRPGAPALLRLAGFPWTQYGALRATVRSVGQELREGRLRVECDLVSDAASPIPVQHGLPGTLEVAVEQASPAALLLRLAGRLVDRTPAVVRPAQVGGG